MSIDPLEEKKFRLATPQEQIDKLSKELKSTRKEHRVLKAKNTATEAENRKLLFSMFEKDQKIKALEASYGDYSTKIQRTLEEKNAEIETFKKRENLYNETIKENKTLSEKLSQLEEKWKNDNKILEDTLLNNKKEYIRSMSKMEKKLEKTNEELGKKGRVIEALNRACREAVRTPIKDKKFESFQEELKLERELKIEAIEEIKRSFQEKICEMQKDLKRKDMLKKDLEFLKDREIDKLQKANDDFWYERTSLNKEIAKGKDVIGKLQMDVVNCNNEVKKIENEKLDLIKQNQEVENRIIKLRIICTTKEEQIENLNKKTEDLQKQNDALQEEINAKNTKLNELEKELNCVRGKIPVLEAEVAKYKSKVLGMNNKFMRVKVNMKNCLDSYNNPKEFGRRFRLLKNTIQDKTDMTKIQSFSAECDNQVKNIREKCNEIIAHKDFSLKKLKRQIKVLEKKEDSWLAWKSQMYESMTFLRNELGERHVEIRRLEAELRRLKKHRKVQR
ncbi:probable DNA double-strand break repair Rad50 ATPase [Cyprinodon tularosa]|uniref:probable DNA double-strand break repair Rad50 ATPase n=1 Tax=Cyprinodon tularosa TaxID=77115 RepID=UPI0018E1E693|nr:probable DNA double-strand break repair Rad50 ATPase [Cyprinodon tularosa]